MNPIDREADILDEQLESGEISEAEYHRAMRDLGADHEAYAREVAQEAYDREMGY